MARIAQPVGPAFDGPACTVQLEEFFGRFRRLLRRARAGDRDAGLAEEPLLAALEILATAQSLKIALVCTGQRKVWANEPQPGVAHHAAGRPRGCEPGYDLPGSEALAPQAVEVAQIPIQVHQRGQAVIEHFTLAPRLGQRVEVVAAGVAVAEKRDARHRHAAERDSFGEQRQDADQPATLADADGPQLAPAAEMLPPRLQPVGREEHAAGAGSGVQCAPLVGAGGADLGIDRLHFDDGGCLRHASSSRTQEATCSASAGERS